MNRLVVITAQDGSSLVLRGLSEDRGQSATALVFEHLGRSAPQPVLGLFSPFSVIVEDQRCVVVAGTTPSRAPVDAVLIQFPDQSRSYPVNNLPDRPGVWMSLPEPFCEGQRIRITWLVGNRVYHENTSAPLVWEQPATPKLSPREPVPHSAIKTEDGFTVSHYAYIENDDGGQTA